MSCKTENTTINDVEYSCTQYPAIQGMKFKLKVIKVIGPALAEILPVLQQKDVDQALVLSKAINTLFLNTDPEELTELIISMLTTGHTIRNGERLTRSKFEEAYAGDGMGEAYKAFIFVLKVNYSNFLKGQKTADFLTKAEQHL